MKIVIEDESYDFEEEVVRIASFDVGKKNLCHWIEEIKLSEIEELEKEYSKIRSIRSKGKKGVDTKSTLYTSFLEKVYASGKRIHTGVYDIRNSAKQDVFDMETRRNLITHLSNLNDLWGQCDTFIIEQQFFKAYTRGKKKGNFEANADAIKISEAIMSWMLNHHPDKTHGFFPATNKTQLLGAPPKLTRSGTKKFCIEQAEKMCKIRKDRGILGLFSLRKTIHNKKNLTEKRKLEMIEMNVKVDEDDISELARKIVDGQKFDDICDGVCQAKAYIIKHLIIGVPFGG